MIRVLKHKSALKGLFGGLLMLLAQSAFSQQTTYNNPIKEVQTARSVVERDGYFYSLGSYFDSQLGKFGVRLVKLDSFGVLVKDKKIINPDLTLFVSNHISLQVTQDSAFATIINLSGNSREYGILKFDANLDTLWLRYITTTDILAPEQLKQLPSGHFISTGYDYDSVKNTYGAFLMLADEQGNYLWHKTYHEPDSISLYPRHVYPTPDGGFLMAGRSELLGHGHESSRNPLLMKTDSLGNLLWKKTYGDWQPDGLASAAILNKDSAILYYAEGVAPYGAPKNHIYMPVFEIIDLHTGTVLKHKSFWHMQKLNFTSHSLLLEDDKIIGCGSYDELDSTKLDRGIGRGYTLALDNNLNEIWFRNYSVRYSLADRSAHNWLYDLRSTNDGGYVASGYAFIYNTTGLNAVFGFNGWVVKLDSNGCLANNCVNHISEEEFEFKPEAKLLEVYPNPSSGYFTISWPGAGSGKAALFDLQGRYIQSTQLVEGIGILNPAGNLREGLYLLQVQHQDGSSRSEKVIIKR